jgi:hypothetical protein
MDPVLVPIFERLKTALDAFALGNAAPYKALWAHTEDVSVLGAFGGRNLGWSDVGPRLDFAASQYQNGHYDDLAVLASGAGNDMAYIVWLEAVSATSAAGEAVKTTTRHAHTPPRRRRLAHRPSTRRPACGSRAALVKTP